jgi:hypothetical protein
VVEAINTLLCGLVKLAEGSCILTSARASAAGRPVSSPESRKRMLLADRPEIGGERLCRVNFAYLARDCVGPYYLVDPSVD